MGDKLEKIKIPDHYDYIGVYLTDKCHLNCSYCITKHHNSPWGNNNKLLSSLEWIEGLNRLILPKDIPITFQGGEPFLYKGIWDILNNITHKIDILTALPGFITKDYFLKLNSLNWNKRNAPYPLIRVSYHKEVHSLQLTVNSFKENERSIISENFEKLIQRVADLNDILSIGVYYLDHPEYDVKEIDEMKAYAKKNNVEFRKKEFLGEYNGKTYGTFKYPDAIKGKKINKKIKCKNTVVPIGPDGTIYRCHSDLYFNRKNVALGNILDPDFVFKDEYTSCENYGLCSECDVKIKTNHLQQFGYTSVDIKEINSL